MDDWIWAAISNTGIVLGVGENLGPREIKSTSSLERGMSVRLCTGFLFSALFSLKV